MNLKTPLSVQYTRGDLVESEHQVDALVVDASGAIQSQFGDIERSIFPRSAVKPIQTLAMFRSGAVEKFNLDHRHIALSCASHSGELVHTDLVSDWLTRLGQSYKDLECGSQQPSEFEAAAQLFCKNQKPTAIHNNCSGKHTGFLSTCLSLGIDPKSYIKYEHELQKYQRLIQSEVFDIDMDDQPWGTDGCGIPSYALPLKALALGASKFLRTDFKYAPAMKQILLAMAKEPYLVAGKNRYCTLVTKASQGKVLAKYGAQGVFFAVAPEKKKAYFLKARSGVPQVAEAALTQLLVQSGALTASEAQLCFSTDIKNWAGVLVGKIHVGPYQGDFIPLVTQ